MIILFYDIVINRKGRGVGVGGWTSTSGTRMGVRACMCVCK